MNRKGKIIQLASIFLVITVISIFFCCAPKDPAVIAIEVAEEWASNNVNDVSKNIAGLVANSNPLIEAAVAMALGQQINQKMSWEYSNPQKLAEERYGLVATAYSEIELPLLGSYKVSVNYNLEIDTKLKQVISANMDASSFAIIKQ
jgi:hypothetical protein